MTFNYFFDNDPEIGSFSDFDLKWNELTSILNHSLGYDDLFYSLTSVDKSYLYLSSTHTWGASSNLNQSQASLSDQSGEVLASSKDEALINFVSCLPDNCVCQVCKDEGIIHRSSRDLKLFNIGSKGRFQKSKFGDLLLEIWRGSQVRWGYVDNVLNKSENIHNVNPISENLYDVHLKQKYESIYFTLSVKWF